jgi:hypothetical protein
MRVTDSNAILFFRMREKDQKWQKAQGKPFGDEWSDLSVFGDGF